MKYLIIEEQIKIKIGIIYDKLSKWNILISIDHIDIRSKPAYSAKQELSNDSKIIQIEALDIKKTSK